MSSAYHYSVTVIADGYKQADEAMSSRLDHDEELGFDYEMIWTPIIPGRTLKFEPSSRVTNVPLGHTAPPASELPEEVREVHAAHRRVLDSFNELVQAVTDVVRAANG